jgi:hypothetical protein
VSVDPSSVEVRPGAHAERSAMRLDGRAFFPLTALFGADSTQEPAHHSGGYARCSGGPIEKGRECGAGTTGMKRSRSTVA